MDRLAKWVALGLAALALGTLGAMLVLDSVNPPPKKKPVDPDSSVPSHSDSSGAHSAAASESASFSPSAAEVLPSGDPHPTQTSLQSEALRQRAERRRAARALLEEFRKPSKAAPDWETTSQQALFLPNGRPVDPYILPPLQLPASLTIENPEIEIMTDIQVSEWERLQDEFIAEVGDSVPTDAASRKTWIRAQRKNDEKFRAKFGTEAFLRQQMDAYRAGFLQE
ncbi:MAG: hypothetical protein ACOYNG_08520 [Terrimicrobiaceae bacterium]